MTLFTIRFRVNEGCTPYSTDYVSFDEFFNDAELKRMFDEERIEWCVVFFGPKRITAPSLMTWERLKDCVIANGTTLLRHAYGG